MCNEQPLFKTDAKPMLGILSELKVENVEAGMLVEEMDLAGSASSSGQIVLKCFFSSPNLTSKGSHGTIHFMLLKSLSGNQITLCIDCCPTKEQSFAVFVAEFNSCC